MSERHLHHSLPLQQTHTLAHTHTNRFTRTDSSRVTHPLITMALQSPTMSLDRSSYTLCPYVSSEFVHPMSLQVSGLMAKYGKSEAQVYIRYVTR